MIIARTGLAGITTEPEATVNTVHLCNSCPPLPASKTYRPRQRPCPSSLSIVAVSRAANLGPRPIRWPAKQSSEAESFWDGNSHHALHRHKPRLVRSPLPSCQCARVCEFCCLSSLLFKEPFLSFTLLHLLSMFMPLRSILHGARSPKLSPSVRSDQTFARRHHTPIALKY